MTKDRLQSEKLDERALSECFGKKDIAKHDYYHHLEESSCYRGDAILENQDAAVGWPLVTFLLEQPYILTTAESRM